MYNRHYSSAPSQVVKLLWSSARTTDRVIQLHQFTIRRRAHLPINQPVHYHPVLLLLSLASQLVRGSEFVFVISLPRVDGDLHWALKLSPIESDKLKLSLLIKSVTNYVTKIAINIHLIT